MTFIGNLARTTAAFAALLALGTSIAVTTATPASAATRSCSSSTSVTNRPTLSYDDRGSCVDTLQTILLKRGYKLGISSPTGWFGPATKSAVERFQAKHHLTVTGQVKTVDWNVLVNAPHKKLSCTYDIRRGPNCSSYVMLTYDDCPRSYTAFKNMVLAAEKMNVGLALFPTGDCVTAGRFNPAYARQHGHYVFNHSVSHPDLTTLSYSNVIKQLSKPGIITNYGRPPYGAYNASVKKAYTAESMRIWMWDVDTNDWRGKSRAAVVSYVIKNTHKGQTVLMHMQWNGFSSTALRQMKSGLAKKGIKICRNYSGATPLAPQGDLRC